MHFARKLFATSVIAAACAVPGALLLSATAAADPAPAPVPPMPAIPGMSFLNPAMAPQLLQGLASAFGGTPAAAAPAAPAATASLTLPQAPAVPAALPATAPAAVPAAAAAPAPGLVPTAEVQLPQVPGSPLPLPQQVNFPGDLASLMPPGLPLAGLLPRSPAAVPAAVPAVPAAVAAVPAAVPAIPAVPAAITPGLPAPVNGLSGLAPLMFPTSGLP